MTGRRSLRTTGILFGIWVVGLYAFTADQINRLNLPGIPLPEPQGGWWGYYLGAVLVGGLVGLVCSWPANLWVGTVLGGLLGSALTPWSPWRAGWTAFHWNISDLATFFARALILMFFVCLLRLAVNGLASRVVELLSVRRLWLPLLVSLLVIGVGSESWYSPRVCQAFWITGDLIQQGIQAPSQTELPESLRPVQGFKPNATGSYILEWSSETAKFTGPRPVVDRPNAEFLIVARFRNGFSMACDFPPEVTQPACANFGSSR